MHDEAEESFITQELHADNMAPVFLTEAAIRDYYEGFSNSTLWPTFHYFPQFALYEQAHQEAYQELNEKFCAAVLALAGPEDTIWIQDYQLLLHALCDNPQNRVVIISGRDRTTLQQWLGHLPLHFIAEHGVWLRGAGAEDWELFQPLRNDWKRELRPVLDVYVARPAGSFIEEKDYSLVWHYRRADAELGAVRARELLSHLSFITANTDLQVLEGNKVLEIKNAGINKGTAALRWLGQQGPGFLLALGDNRTDEDTFRALPPEAYTVRVGSALHSAARFHLASPTDVHHLLRQLIV